MSLSINEFAVESIIPKRVLRYLHREGIVSEPLGHEDQVGLRFLEKVWGVKEVLRPQLSKLSMPARISLVRTADLASKWERYAYSRFRNQPQGTKLLMKIVREEIEVTFGFRLSKQQKNRLYTLRNRAQVARSREKNRAEKNLKTLLPCANK